MKKSTSINTIHYKFHQGPRTGTGARALARPGFFMGLFCFAPSLPERLGTDEGLKGVAQSQV